MSKNIERLMIIITALDDKASIKYSVNTGKFYVHTNIISKDTVSNYTFTTQHRSNIDDAVIDFYKMIQGKTVKVEGSKEEFRLPILIK